MIDLVLWSNTKANFRTFAIANNLLDANGNVRPGIEYFWWDGEGKFTTVAATVDGNGNVTAPATYLAGFVLVMRITDSTDGINNPVDGEQWSRSKVANYIKTNGTPGTVGGIDYYELNNVRIFRAATVVTWLSSRSLGFPEWYGWNQI